MCTTPLPKKQRSNSLDKINKLTANKSKRQMHVPIPSALDIPAEFPQLPVVAGDLVRGVSAALEVETGSVAGAGATDEGDVVVERRFVIVGDADGWEGECCVVGALWIFLAFIYCGGGYGETNIGCGGNAATK